MAVVIVATVGSASANAFCTLAEADTYLEGKLPSPTTWDAASDDTCNRALVSATRELSALGWQGEQTTATQALAWPRQWVVDPKAPSADYIDPAIVPDAVKAATVELALLMVNAGTTDLAALPSSEGVVQRVVGELSTTYADPGQRPRGIWRFPSVTRFLRGLVAASGGPSVTLVRG